ncbi:MAG: AAA family ATPase [Thermoanaerobaculia bacterium]|jgi:predicted ATPase
MTALRRLTVKGFKSIRALEEFELRKLNVLIGPNGAGKSNFIGLFRMLAETVERRLQLFVQQEDGPDALLFGSRKETSKLVAEFYFGRNGYRITLEPAGQRLVFSREQTWFEGDFVTTPHSLGSGHEEAKLGEVEDDTFSRYVLPAIKGWRVFHFHDTSRSAPIRQSQPARDNLSLKPDAANLAPFLRFLRERHTEHFERIVDAVRIVAPFFLDFVYRKDASDQVELEWFEVDRPDTPVGVRQLSDGTLRFIALATLLLQPERLQPATILIDEPELGLHPAAIAALGAMLRQASGTKQIIVSTQSPQLINEFEPEDVIVVDRVNGESLFGRLDRELLKEWLEDYALADLWNMNVLGGRPRG